jgi:hypothetical protein
MNEILHPGTYYLGDASLVVEDKIYNGIYGELYHYENGLFNINNANFAIHNVATQFDSDLQKDKFFDTKGRSYNIKSGMISLVSLELIENKKLCTANGHIFEFDHPVNFIYSHGTFYIKSNKKVIIINTIYDFENYDSDNDEHCLDEEGHKIEHFLDASDSESIYELSDDENYEDDEEEIQDNSLLERKKTFFNK